MPSKSLKQKDTTFNLDLVLKDLLPAKEEGYYSLDEIDEKLKELREELELRQRQSNDKFDAILDNNAKDKLKNLPKNLNQVQLGVMKLQCDIAFTQDQCKNLKTVCDNPIVQERRDLVTNEQVLTESVHQVKFNQLKEFFDKLIYRLNETIVNCQKSFSFQSRSHNQVFDWSQYHHAVVLLRVCGKALIDVERFERLYQSNLDIAGINFKQSLESLDFNQLIDSKSTYSLESLIEVTTGANRRQGIKEFMAEPRVEAAMNSQDPIKYVLMDTYYTKLNNITKSCCKLLTDLNLNYIEAYLTEGITIDKLNNCEDGAQQQHDQPTLPMYAFSPQEYITQIGQHLLSLRKQTEPLDSTDDQPLRLALESLDESTQVDVKSCKTITEAILKCIARLCIRSLLGRTGVSIMSKLSSNGKRQLATDAIYLDNILEDLGSLNADGPYVDKFKALLIQ